MPVRMDKSVWTVTVDSVDVSEYVMLPLRCSFGFDLRIAEASLRFHELPSGMTNWSTVAISMGRSSLAADTTGNVSRFSGFAYDATYELWPYTLQIPCKGPLILADVTRVQDNEWSDGVDLTQTADFLAEGIDMSADSAGNPWDAKEQIEWILGQCGLTSYIDPVYGIGATEHLLGTIATEQFVWRTGQSGLDYIEELDKIGLGFRTHDAVGGYIRRVCCTPRVPFLDTRTDVTEGTHPFEGTILTYQQAEACNRVVVNGWDDGGLPAIYVTSGGFATMPPSVAWVTYPFSSPMIELEEQDTVNSPKEGISCQEIGDWLLLEKGYPYWDGTVVTWQDTLFSPGDTVYLNAPHLGSVMQQLWIRHVDIEIGSDGSFTQRLQVRGIDLGSRSPRPTMSATLPLFLMRTP